MSQLRARTTSQAQEQEPHVINRRPVEVLPKPDLTTTRLNFRLLNPADEDAFIDALRHSRPLLRRWIPINAINEPNAKFFHRTMMKGRVQDIEGNAWRRGAFLENGRFVGMFNLIKIERGLEWSCEANWWVDARLSGLGLGTEGVQGMIDYALADHPVGLGMHRVRSLICADNAASVRLASKCGFSRVGGSQMLPINKALVRHDEYDCWVGRQSFHNPNT